MNLKNSSIFCRMKTIDHVWQDVISTGVKMEHQEKSETSYKQFS